MGLAGLTSISGTFFNQVYGKDMKKNTIEDDKNSIKNIAKLPETGTWPTEDPFLFCVHHHDVYPSANQNLGPNASLFGRDIGQDFSNKDGWSMYHGSIIPGFPRHPHRGFETVTIVEKGLIDHADSLGAAARYGNGDVQWLTAGNGIQHAEMFPLFDKVNNNAIDFFQIWVNLPASRKRVEPYFSMFWADKVPVINIQDSKGRITEVTIIAGQHGKNKPPTPPPDSWASESKNNFAMWIIKLQSNAEWVLPATSSTVNRSLYIVNGNGIKIGTQLINARNQVELIPDNDVTITDNDGGTKLLLLQGEPISEPIVKHGPFVMNTQSEIRQAYYDYQNTQFGGWNWGKDDPVHGKEYKRFAKLVDGREEKPS
jgi:hypothetical protein